MISTKHILNRIENQIKNDTFSNKAAVLIPIVNNNGLNLLFEVRASTLRWQPGDICFPGGKMDAKDNSPIDTAIRETSEELGIAKNEIKIYGKLPSFFSTIGLKIYPIVGEMKTSELNINRDEVAHTFSVPINWFIENPPIKANMAVAHKPMDGFPFELIPKVSKEWQQRTQHDVYIYHYKDFVIWGVTAQIIQLFLKTIN